MDVAYLLPLRRAIARSREMLFRPFRLETWFKLGFAAFLSQWMSGAWGSSGWRERLESRGGLDVDVCPSGWPDFLPALAWGPLLAAVALTVLALVLVVLWVGSRGKFVFLDDVVRRRAAIVEPWRRFARLGNSLFFWRLGFLVVAGLLMAAVVLGTIGTTVLGWIGRDEPVAMAPGVIGGIALAGLAGLLVGFVSLLLDDFVVPLMYRHDLTATAAWRRFLPLLRAHPGPFVLYALFVLALLVVVFGAVMALGFATCCIGFVLLSLPYIAHVVVLPVHVAFRGLGPEFLAQFGADFDAFAGSAEPAAGPAGPGPWLPA